MAGMEFRVEVIFERREDGGLRVYSPEVPGLVLSSDNLGGLLEDVPTVLSACLSHTLGKPISVAPLHELKDVLGGRVDDADSRAAPGRRQFVAHVH